MVGLVRLAIDHAQWELGNGIELIECYIDEMKRTMITAQEISTLVRLVVKMRHKMNRMIAAPSIQ